MNYVEILTRINTINNVYDVEEIVRALESLSDREEYESAKDALFRAVLSKARDEHPRTKNMAAYALTLRA